MSETTIPEATKDKIFAFLDIPSLFLYHVSCYALHFVL